MFENTLALVDDAGLSYLHVFPFSARQGTPAARMPQLDPRSIKERARALREKGVVSLGRHLAKLIGTEQELLVEKRRLGRTGCFASVAFEDDAPAGSIIRANITACDGRIAKARVLNPVQQGVRAHP
jgi:threonylcarbamoyladenosine tRNA methylthiotransferase MtaB